MGPGVISFSGGRTSAFMLAEMQRRGDLTNPELHVLFCNTGREREETLAFVDAVGRNFGVTIHWLEWNAPFGPAEEDSLRGFREVDFTTADRAGKPFSRLIGRRNFLPNPVARFCTQELKIRVMRDWMKDRGYEHWTNFVGIRADEPRRVARLRNPTKRERWDVAMPLADWGVTLVDVNAFWSRQSFRLELQQHEGNCDLCFLKTAEKRVRIANERPDLAEWWHEEEKRLGAPFRKEGTLQQHIDLDKRRKILAEAQGDLFTCFCGDDAEEA